MNPAPFSRAARGAATVSRLLDAAVVVLRDEGAAAVSIQRVADVAGTSKGLVHYHFTDKDALLIACVEQLASRLVAEEAPALSASTSASALDDLWTVLSRPDYCGRRRALLALMTAPTAQTRPALAEAFARRHTAAAHTVDALTRLLHFDVPLSRSALSIAFMSLTDGLLLGAGDQIAERHRQAYDAFWLAVLSLTA